MGISMTKYLTWLALMLLMPLIASQWTPSRCPSHCICHRVWNSALHSKLNSVDCKDRDLTDLDVVPEDADALVLRGNQLSVEMLGRRNLTSIQCLDLSTNQFKLHQVDALQVLFAQLEDLRALDISDNYLETIQSSLFKELKSLEFLSLSGNAVVFIEQGTFQDLTKLRVLQLDRNRLRTVNENWFNNSSLSLRDLDLSSNRLESILGGDLMWLTELERLTVNHNNLSYIHPDAFADSNIRELYLSHNQLQTVLSDTLSPLKELEILKIDGNPIRSLEDHSFTNHLYIKHISLSNMPLLRAVHKLAFSNLPSLIKVDLFQNAKLEYVHPEAFKNCSKLELLYLHGGSLRGLDEALGTHLPMLTELSLYNNQIECSCLAKWLRNTTINIIDGNRIVCAGPHAYKMVTLYQLSDSQLELKCAPLVILQSAPRVLASFGTDVNLECQALGSTSIQWNVSPRSASALNTTNDGRLNLARVQHSDEGVYTCVATSDNKESDSASVDVRVIHSLIKLTAVTVSKSFIVLQWEDAQGPTVMSYATSDGQAREVSIPTGINQYTVDNLVPDTSYVFCLLYHHRLEQSCITVHMLQVARTDTTSTNNSQINNLNVAQNATVQSILIAVATCSVAVVLAVILALVYKKFQRNRKSKVLYLRQKDECMATVESAVSVKLEKCYNPTTEPLVGNELT